MNDPAEADRANVLFCAWLMARAVTARIDAALEGTGLSADEFAIYSVLAATDGMTPSELAEWMSAPPTTVSSVVARFSARGHIERTTNPRDRRSYRVRLNAGGRAAHHAAGNAFAPILADVEHRLGTGLSDVERTLLLLRTTVAATEPAPEDPRT